MITLKKLVAVGIVLAATSATAFAASTPPATNGTTTAAPPVSGSAAPATQPATKATQPAHHMAMSQKKVEAIQTALNNNGEKIAVDGRWGHKTMAAVKDFQQKHGLKATGHADKKTLEQLKIGA